MSNPVEVERYELVDRHTGKVLGTYKPSQRKRARNRVDKLDNEYGAYRYGLNTIWRNA